MICLVCFLELGKPPSTCNRKEANEQSVNINTIGTPDKSKHQKEIGQERR